MTMQTIPDTAPTHNTVEPATPKPRLERVSDARPRSTSDALVDAAMEALSAPPPAESPVDKPAPKQARKEAREGDGEQKEALSREPTPKVENEEGEAEPDAEAEAEAHAGEDTRGSEQDPFTVKDLPSDKFIELKIDGEKVKVPLSELASGYIREQTFSRRLNQTKELTERAKSMAEAAQAFPEKLRSQFKAWTSDPKEVLSFFLESDDREAVLEQVARSYAEMRIQHRERPELRLQFQRERDQRRLDQERQRFHAEREALVQKQQQEEQHKRALSVWQPGWAEGLRRAGFPVETPQLREEVVLRCRQRVESGQVVTSDDIAEFVVRAAKLLELPKKTDQRPKAAPAPAPKDERRERTNGTDWSKVPAHKRRQNPDYFLSSLKPRDYR